MLLDLSGKKILVTGIANNRSIAWGIAQQLKAAGAELGITYLPDEKGRFEAKVRDLTAPLNPSLFLPLNVQDQEQMEAVFQTIGKEWGTLDGLVHCLAFAGKEELIEFVEKYDEIRKACATIPDEMPRAIYFSAVI